MEISALVGLWDLYLILSNNHDGNPSITRTLGVTREQQVAEHQSEGQTAVLMEATP